MDLIALVELFSWFKYGTVELRLTIEGFPCDCYDPAKNVQRSLQSWKPLFCDRSVFRDVMELLAKTAVLPRSRPEWRLTRETPLEPGAKTDDCFRRLSLR